MDVLKTIAIFVGALMGELGGTYAVWRWRRVKAGPLRRLRSDGGAVGASVILWGRQVLG
jgi:hypothetical protein